jgi:hypothetical protein
MKSTYAACKFVDVDIPTNLSDKTQVGFVKWEDLK